MMICRLLVLALLLVSSEAMAADPIASFIASRTTCIAPCFVHFDATGTTDADTTVPAIALSYEWDFGDPYAGNWAYGAIADDGTGAAGIGPSKNVDFGVSAAHVFETPGEYLVKLFVRDAVTGDVASVDSERISVHFPSDYTTHCFSRDTDQSGCIGTNHDNHSGDLDVAVNVDCNGDSGNKLICSFQRDDVWNSDSVINLSGSEVILRAHDGAGAPPLINNTLVVDGGGLFHVTANISDYIFMDIDSSGSDTENETFFDLAESTGETLTDVLFLRVNLTDYDGAIEIEGGPSVYGPDGDATNGGVMHRNWGFIDGSILDAPGCSDIDMFVMGHGYAIMGNKLGDKEDPHPDDATDCSGWQLDSSVETGNPDTCNPDALPTAGPVGVGGYGCGPGAAEHVLRSKFNDGGVTSHNSMGLFTHDGNHDGCGVRGATLTGGQAHVIKQVAGFAAQHLDPAGHSRHFVYADNAIHSCSESATTVDIDATSTSGVDDEHFFEYLFEGNHCIAGTVEWDNNPTCFELAGADVMVRNNSCEFNGGAIDGGRCIRINDRRVAPTNASPENFHIYNNTCYFGDETTNLVSGNCLSIDEGTGHDVSNNLLYDTDGTPTMISDTATGTTFCNAGALGNCNLECEDIEGGGSDCNTSGSSTNPFAGTLLAPTPMSELALVSTATLIDGGVNLEADGFADAFHDCRSTTMDVGLDEFGASECPSIEAPDLNILNSMSSVGINLHRNRYRETVLPWANAAKMALEWQDDDTAGCDFTASGSSGATVDASGYPTALDAGAVCTWTQLYNAAATISDWPQGTWQLDYDGTATAVSGGAASGLTGAAGDYTFTTSTTGTAIQIGFEGADFSDVRIYPPGGVCAANATAPYDFEPWGYCDPGAGDSDLTDTTDTVTCGGSYPTCIPISDAAEFGGLRFHPLFVSRLREYRTLRMMDWAHTNNSNIADAEDYTPESYWTWEYNDHTTRPGAIANPGGVPLRVQAELCETLGSECWFNLPILATDAEISRFADAVRDLTTGPVLFELTNESWNGGFDQESDADAAAVAEFGCTEGDECRDSWIGERTIEMCNLIEASFDATGEDSRMNCVLGDQASIGTPVLEARLDRPCAGDADADCLPANTLASTADLVNVDAIAIAPYVNDDACATSAATVCGVLDTDIALKYVDTGGGDSIMDIHYSEITSRSLGKYLLAYEGGTDLQIPSNSVCLAANQDACIGTVMNDMLDAWEAHQPAMDLRTYVLFDHVSAYEGSIENLFGLRGSWFGDQATWPKEDGVLTWQDSNPCWWTDCDLAAVPVVPTPSMQGGSISGGSLSLREQLELMFQIVGVPNAR